MSARLRDAVTVSPELRAKLAAERVHTGRWRAGDPRPTRSAGDQHNFAAMQRASRNDFHRERRA